MGTADFCANFCWIVGLAGVIFLGMMAVQVQYENDYLLPNKEMKTTLTVHLFIAAGVILCPYLC
jgi:hypothetical protein